MTRYTPFRRAWRLCGALVLGTVAPAAAQFPQWSTFPLPYVDARVLPSGVLHVGFLPSYAQYAERFRPDGTPEPLGATLSADTAGANLFPSLLDAQQAVRAITGDTSYRMNLGRVRTLLEVDVRRFPLDLALGITRRITLGVRVPLVKTRVQGVLALADSGANVGWNQAALAAQNAPGLAQIVMLLGELQAAATSLESGIASGSYGCPGSAQCAEANALLQRVQLLLVNLQTLTGPPDATPALPPVAPLAQSPAGLAIAAEIDSVAAHLAALGAAPVTARMAFPASALDSAAVQGILTGAEFGYSLSPLATPRRTYTLGDAEISLRVALATGDRARAVLTGLVRLPTGQREVPSQLLDVGTGDRQLDLEGGVELAFEPGRLGISATALYTRQFASRLPLRWATPEQPLALSQYDALTDRKLGDVLRLAVFPSLRLAEGFRVYGSAYYFRKAEDRYALAPGVAPAPGMPTPQDAARGTGGQSLSIGGGIAYRAVRSLHDTTVVTTLPVEAGLSYQAAFLGSDGLVPRSSMLNLYVKVYYQVFGRRVR